MTRRGRVTGREGRPGRFELRGSGIRRFGGTGAELGARSLGGSGRAGRERQARFRQPLLALPRFPQSSAGLWGGAEGGFKTYKEQLINLMLLYIKHQSTELWPLAHRVSPGGAARAPCSQAASARCEFGATV